MKGKGRNYKFYLSVSCSGKDLKRTNDDAERTRSAAKLENTINDCELWYERLRKDDYDTGIEEKHLKLENPTKKEFIRALNLGMEFLNNFKDEKPWEGGQVTIFFAGHGSKSRGELELSDSYLSANELLEVLLLFCDDTINRLRLDLILDSCYSGSFLIDLLSNCLLKTPEDFIFLCEIGASSLPWEESKESDRYKHGYFTYSFAKGLIDLDKIIIEKIENVKMIKYGEEGEPHWFSLEEKVLLDDIFPSFWEGSLLKKISNDTQHAIWYINDNLQILGKGDFFIFDIEIDYNSIWEKLRSMS